MDNDEVEVILAEIASLLEAGHEEQFALPVRDVLSGSAQALEAFLRSNELWEERVQLPTSPLTAGRYSVRNWNGY